MADLNEVRQCRGLESGFDILDGTIILAQNLTKVNIFAEGG